MRPTADSWGFQVDCEDHKAKALSLAAKALITQGKGADFEHNCKAKAVS